jgi:hypothetical protein
VPQLLVTANVPNSSIFSTLMMEAMLSTETSVLTSATRHHISEDGILHNHRNEYLKTYRMIDHIGILLNKSLPLLFIRLGNIIVTKRFILHAVYYGTLVLTGLKDRQMFFQVLRAPCILQEFKFPPKF